MKYFVRTKKLMKLRKSDSKTASISINKKVVYGTPLFGILIADWLKNCVGDTKSDD
jgi:hypothetical protein